MLGKLVTDCVTRSKEEKLGVKTRGQARCPRCNCTTETGLVELCMSCVRDNHTATRRMMVTVQRTRHRQVVRARKQRVANYRFTGLLVAVMLALAGAIVAVGPTDDDATASMRERSISMNVPAAD